MATSIQGESLSAGTVPAPGVKRAPGSFKISTTMLAGLLAAVGGALPFLPALRYGFVHDDDLQVLANIAAMHAQSVWAYFISSIWAFRDSKVPLNTAEYRPLFQTYLRLNALFFDNSYFWWHFAGIAVHLAMCVLVFQLIRHYVRNPWAAMVGALVFAVHPAQTESVVWVSGAAGSLMGLGLMGSFLLWLKKREAGEARQARWMAGASACYAAAILCQQQAVALPAIIFGCVAFGIADGADGAERNSFARRIGPAIAETLPFLAVTAVYYIARFAVLHSFGTGAQRWVSTSQVLLTAPAVLFFYLRHIVWPTGLRLFYDFPVVTSVASARFWAPLLVEASAVAGLLEWWRRAGSTAANVTVKAAALWLLIPLLPVLDIAAFSEDDFVHDRYLYLPLVGLGLLCAVLADKVIAWARAPWQRQVALACATLGIAALGALTLTQTTPWRDNFSLYAASIRNSQNRLARADFAAELANKGRLEPAKEMLDSVIAERPDLPQANYNLGYVEYRLHDMDDARRHLDRAIALDPSIADAYLYRGLVAVRDGDDEKGVALLRRATSINPSGESYHLALGIMQRADNPEAAKAEFREELKFYPNSGMAQLQLEQLIKATAKNTPAGTTAAPNGADCCADSVLSK